MTKEAFEKHCKDLAACNVEKLQVNQDKSGILVYYKSSFEPECNLQHLTTFHHFMEHPQNSIEEIEGRPGDGHLPANTCRLCSGFTLDQQQYPAEKADEADDQMDDRIDCIVDHISEVVFLNTDVTWTDANGQTNTRHKYKLLFRVHWSPEFANRKIFYKYDEHIIKRMEALLAKAEDRSGQTVATSATATSATDPALAPVIAVVTPIAERSKKGGKKSKKSATATATATETATAPLTVAAAVADAAAVAAPAPAPAPVVAVPTPAPPAPVANVSLTIFFV